MARTAARLTSNLGGRSLVLVGLMGAGKSTIGKRVAGMLELPFHDADHEIEKAAQMSVPELFETYGEPEFRDLERRVILRLIRQGPMVLATGGGAYMNEETRKAIAEHGISIWLNADLEVLMERVLRRQNRPLLKNDNPRGVMEKLMADRYPVYAKADLTINSRKARRDVVARDVVRTVERHLTKQDKHKGA
ncbi:shikimate kinase [Bartonella sp. LJL80]